VTGLIDELRAISTTLSTLGQQFALVGGLAVSVRAEPRFTRDADLAVAVVDDEAAERLIHQLRLRGYEISALVEQAAKGRLATVRLLADGEQRIITDLLFASSGIECEIVAAADDIEVVSGVRLPVASVGHLIAMKLLSREDRRRPADADDLRALSEVASHADWVDAERACALIAARGFHRDRDLVGLLASLRRDGPYGE
jgi:Nucleotidyl transferase AbiEii toxin, Type IV TA system